MKEAVGLGRPGPNCFTPNPHGTTWRDACLASHHKNPHSRTGGRTSLGTTDIRPACLQKKPILSAISKCTYPLTNPHLQYRRWAPIRRIPAFSIECEAHHEPSFVFLQSSESIDSHYCVAICISRSPPSKPLPHRATGNSFATRMEAQGAGSILCLPRIRISQHFRHQFKGSRPLTASGGRK